MEDPEQKLVSICPPQLALNEAAVQMLETGGDAAEAAGFLLMLFNALIILVVGGSLSMLWTMVNALQMSVALTTTKIKLPAIVYLVMSNIAVISGFEVIPPDDVVNFFFPEGFTETQPVNTGWLAMNNETRVATSNVAMVLVMVLFTAG